MAGRIKGITVEIGGDTTKLSKALESVNKQIKNTQSQLKDVEKLLKLDPGNTELLAQKHKLLGDAVAQTKEKLETLKTAAEQANEALARGEISQEQYDALQREILETEQDLKRLEEQANQSATAMQKIAATGEKLKTVGDNISGVGEKLMPVTAGVVALGTAAVKTASDFDSAMSKVAAVSGATGDELEALRDKAREMGSKTKFSASEAAEAMNYMAMAGWKTSDMLSGIEGVMNLAAASGEDLATTSDIVTDALTAFGLTASDSAHFADVLAAASSNANTNVSMMGETFKYAAPIAGSLGFSVEDTAEAIGLMANAGIKSTQAGTSLRTIMTNLSGEVKICGSAIGEVTVATTNADGSMRNLSDILADCRTAFGGLSESEKAAAAETLVGKNAMSGFLALMNAAPADIDKLSNAIAKCDGTSQSMADTMQDNLAGQLTVLKSQLEELAISFGELLVPIIRSVVSAIQGFVDKLNGMDEGTRKFILTIAAVVAALGPVLIVIGKVISAVGTIMTVVPKIAGVIKTVKTAFAALNAVMLANPIVLVIAAIAALVAAFIYLWNNCEGFRQFWIDLWNGIKDAAVAAWEGIKSFFQSAWEAISTTALTIWNGLKDFFSGLWEGIQSVFTAAWSAISGVMTSIWSTITSVWQSIYDTISPLLEAFRYLFETIFEAIRILIERAWTAIATKVQEVWTAITEFLAPILESIKTLFETVWNAIFTAITTVLTAIQTVVTTVWNAIRDAVSAILSAIRSVVSTAWNSIKSVVTTVMNAISNTVKTIWNNVKGAISSIIGQIYNVIRSGFEKADGYVKGLASQAFGWGRDLIMGIVNGIKSCISAVTNAVNGVANKIRSVLHFSVPDEGPLTDYENWMPDFMAGLAKGIEQSRGMIQKAVSGVAADMVINPKVSGAEFAYAGGGRDADSTTSIVSAIREALSGQGTNSGDIVIPVYIGGNALDEVIVTAQQRMNLRSGGR